MNRLCTLALFLVLGGCATLEPLTTDTEHRVVELTESGEYGKALSALDRLIARDPDNKALQTYRGELERRAARFEQAILIEAAGCLRVEDWAGARERYDHGVSVLPESEALIAARAAFETERQHHLRALRTRLLLARAHALIRERPMYEEIHRVSPGSIRARHQYQRAERDAREMSVELFELGETALGADDPLLAVEALTLAHALSPAPESAARLEEAESARQSRLREFRVQTPETGTGNGWTEQDHALLERYHAALRADDMALARPLLDALASRHPENESLRVQRAVLTRIIDIQVSAGLEQGLRLYAEGRIREALEIWRPLRALAPNNRELEARVERAERVLERLETLK
jgi:tetratricopeptide (TPR) repeat protein